MSKPKTLRLIALAALAVTAALATSAQAAKYTSGKTPNTHMKAVVRAHMHGGKVANYIEANGTQVTCEEIALNGEFSGTATELELTPEFTHCAAGSLPSTVTTNGCFFTISEPSFVSETEYTGSFDLKCPSGNTITIDTYASGSFTSHSFQVCRTTIAPQDEVGHVEHILVEDAQKKIDDITTIVESKNGIYTRDGLCGSGEFNDGKIVSKYTETAINLDGQIDFWISK